MNRIDFFKRLFAGGAAVIAAKYAGAVVPEAKKDVYLDSVYIAGFQYYKGTELEKRLKENDILSLRRQAENQHDYFAVEVYCGEQKLGYLPRADNKIIARMMDQGVSMKAIIRKVEPEVHPFRRVKVRVYSEMG
ncbi:MAG: HIRAN domain-containing protein [Draconibacterium sp.]